MSTIHMKYKSTLAHKDVRKGGGYVPEEKYDDAAPLRTFVNSAMREPYVPTPDHHYRAGSMEYKTLPSRGNK